MMYLLVCPAVAVWWGWCNMHFYYRGADDRPSTWAGGTPGPLGSHCVIYGFIRIAAHAHPLTTEASLTLLNCMYTYI